MSIYQTCEFRQWVGDSGGWRRTSVDGIVECEPASLHTGINSSDSTYETQITATSRNMRVLLKQKRWQQLVLQQLNDLGWHLIRKVSIDFTEVSIDVRDVADTSATLVLKLSADYPLKWPEIEAGSLMVAPNYFAAHHTFRLADIRKEYLKGMVYYAPILQQLRHIDDNTVCTPYPEARTANGSATPSLSVSGGDVSPTAFVPISTKRKVLVQHPHLHAIVSLNPANPTQHCLVTFLGPTNLRREFEVRWNERCRHWDSALYVLENLERILEVRFPSKGNLPVQATALLHADADGAEATATSVECSICYSSLQSFALVPDSSSGAPKRRKQLEKPGDLASVPRTTCCNSKCNHVYHAACVRIWLSSLSNCKVSFGTMYGTCPYCASELQIADV